MRRVKTHVKNTRQLNRLTYFYFTLWSRNRPVIGHAQNTLCEHILTIIVCNHPAKIVIHPFGAPLPSRSCQDIHGSGRGAILAGPRRLRICAKVPVNV